MPLLPAVLLSVTLHCTSLRFQRMAAEYCARGAGRSAESALRTDCEGARAQSEVVLSDRSDAALQLCRHNIALNRPPAGAVPASCALSARKLCWAVQPGEDEAGLGPFDVRYSSAFVPSLPPPLRDSSLTASYSTSVACPAVSSTLNLDPRPSILSHQP